MRRSRTSSGPTTQGIDAIALTATVFMVVLAAVAGACKTTDPASAPTKDVPSDRQLKPDPAPTPMPNAIRAPSSSSIADALRDADYEAIELFGFGPTGIQYFEVGGTEFRVAWSRSLDAEERSRLRALIGALPDGESAKCHWPPFGLRFGTGPRALRVSICFRCSNVYVGGKYEGFHAGSAPGRELLAFLQARAPAGWQPSEGE